MTVCMIVQDPGPRLGGGLSGYAKQVARYFKGQRPQARNYVGLKMSRRAPLGPSVYNLQIRVGGRQGSP